MNGKIPVMLISSSNSNHIYASLKNCSRVLVIETFFSKVKENVEKTKSRFPDSLIVLDVDSLDVERAIITSILLRNNGEQVIISCQDDFEYLMPLMEDLHRFLKHNIVQSVPYRTEIMVTEKALEKLGEITHIIKAFEKDYVGNKAFFDAYLL